MMTISYPDKTDEQLLRAFVVNAHEFKPHYPRWLAISTITNCGAQTAKDLCDRFAVSATEKAR